MFTRVEKDKVTIEHILPQTPTKWYWRNTYRMFGERDKVTIRFAWKFAPVVPEY